MIDPKGCSETATSFRTVGDLRKLIDGASDDLPVYLYYYNDTVYDLEGEIRTQRCIEHSGKVHDVTGLIIQIEG